MIAPLMHQLVLRVLLLAVFFNTAIGMPLHAAVHMQGHLHGPSTEWAPAALHTHADEAHAHGDDAGEGCAEPHAEAHAQCVWCPAQAQLGMALASAPAAPLPLLALPAVFNAAVAKAWLPQPERWRFAARDPPSMS